MKTIFKYLKILITISVIWLLGHSIFITIDGLYDKKETANVAIVMGNKVNEDGTLSQRLKERLDKSIEIYHNKRAKYIIVSGGLGKEGFWEAEEMKKYLVKNQIPNHNIIVDNYGNNTRETVINSIKIMDSLGCKSALSVSQYFHQTRAKMLFRKNGVKNIQSSSPHYFEWRDIYATSREFLAFYSQLY